MNQFFEGLANQNNAEVTSVVTKENSSINLSGNLTITKGLMSIDINYWGSTYRSMYPGFASADDIDWETLETRIGGVKIDFLSKFNEGLSNMGLTSVSNDLKISNEEIINEINKAMGASELFKIVYKGLKMFNLAPFEERKKAVLEHSILNYDQCSAYTLNHYGLSESKSNKPSLEELIKLKKK